MIFSFKSFFIIQNNKRLKQAKTFIFFKWNSLVSSKIFQLGLKFEIIVMLSHYWQCYRMWFQMQFNDKEKSFLNNTVWCSRWCLYYFDTNKSQNTERNFLILLLILKLAPSLPPTHWTILKERLTCLCCLWFKIR